MHILSHLVRSSNPRLTLKTSDFIPLQNVMTKSGSYQRSCYRENGYPLHLVYKVLVSSSAVNIYHPLAVLGHYHLVIDESAMTVVKSADNRCGGSKGHKYIRLCKRIFLNASLRANRCRANLQAN
jgi:hypothetical protein